MSTPGTTGPAPPRASAAHGGPFARAALLVLAAAALTAIGFVAVHKQVRDGNDFPIYWQAARDLMVARSPYDVGSGLHGYVYLPWFALLLLPLALLPLPAAAACWYAANLAFVVLAGRALLAAIGAVAPGTRGSLLVLATLPLVGLFHDNLVLGQANLLLLLFVAATAQGALRPRASWAHGIPLGFAAALKMPAAMLLLPLVLRARGRAALGFVLGVAFALALPLLSTGVPLGSRLLHDWQAKVIAPAAAGTLQGSRVIDQSPHAALRRLLVADPAYDGRRVNVARLEPAAFARVSRGVALLLLAAYLFVWLAAPARATDRALLLDLALGCCAMVQVTGFNLKAQFVVLLLPAWLAAALAWRAPARAPRALVVSAGLLFLLSQSSLVGRPLSNLLLAYSSMAAGTLLLATALVRLRFGTRGHDGQGARLTPPPSGARAGAPAPGTAP